MTKFDNPLADVRIASPCSARWEDMYGDERMRFCGECKLNVYNLSGMKKYDAENLFRLAEGRVCVRYYQRQDGTILTLDCPVGWARVKERVTVFATAALSIAISLFGVLFLASGFFKKTEIRGRIDSLLKVADPRPEPLMGAVALPDKKGKETSSNNRQLPIYSRPHM
ncbi:MAG TPA: hypothetical protein VJV05_13675 [Pyrinomonadaceae bacterium]|nr:hypothetical protein [Pyrinomonadaceae bacterium]